MPVKKVNYFNKYLVLSTFTFILFFDIHALTLKKILNDENFTLLDVSDPFDLQP